MQQYKSGIDVDRETGARRKRVAVFGRSGQVDAGHCADDESVGFSGDWRLFETPTRERRRRYRWEWWRRRRRRRRWVNIHARRDVLVACDHVVLPQAKHVDTRRESELKRKLRVEEPP
jgi:hypothetical protein